MSDRKFLLVSSRKGLIVYRRNTAGKWEHHQTHFLGIPVTLATIDPVTGTWWALLDHGHWGCKLHRSRDGKQWEELPAPKYPEDKELKPGVAAATKYLWAFSNGGVDRPGEIFIGTVPGGLFHSKDNGDSFQLITGIWDHPSRDQWFGGGFDDPGIHSILVDPRNSDHITIGISVAGVFKSEDGGLTWQVRNKGLRADFLPDPASDIGQDPHLVVTTAADPDVLWQQNHCGIYRSADGGLNWSDISQPGGLANFGFAIAADQSNPEVAWVVPGVSDEIRVAVDRALCVCRTEDGGKTWQELRHGLPQSHCFDIVYRHALANNGNSLAFGTTTGNVYFSEDGGDKWNLLNGNLPMVYAIEFANP